MFGWKLFANGTTYCPEIPDLIVPRHMMISQNNKKKHGMLNTIFWEHLFLNVDKPLSHLYLSIFCTKTMMTGAAIKKVHWNSVYSVN